MERQAISLAIKREPLPKRCKLSAAAQTEGLSKILSLKILHHDAGSSLAQHFSQPGMMLSGCVGSCSPACGEVPNDRSRLCSFEPFHRGTRPHARRVGVSRLP